MAAKGEVGFIEKHVEKGVLGAAGLALLVVGLIYLPGSPRRIALSNSLERCPPAKVDDALHQQERIFKNQLEQDQPANHPIPDFLTELSRWRATPFDPSSISGQYVRLVPPRPALEPLSPDTGQPRGTLRLADLLPLVRPEAPKVSMHREVQMVSPQTPGAMVMPSAERKPVEVVAVHGAGVVEHGIILAKWKQALESASLPAAFLVVTVEVERRQLQADGSWSGPASVSPPAGAFQVPPLPGFDGNNLDRVLLAITDLSRTDMQQEIIEPNYPDIVWPDRRVGTWMINKPRTRVSDLLDSASSAMGTMLPSPAPVAPRVTPVGPAPGLPGPSPSGSTMDELTRMREMMMRMGPPPVGPTTPGARPPQPAPGLRPPPPRTPALPRPVPVAPVGPAVPAVPTPEPVLVPSVAQQLDDARGILEVWFHDARDLVEGQTYQYRYRLALLNPLFGRFRDVAAEDDARTLTLTTEWSDWSADVTVARPTRFFLVGHFLQRDQVVVEVFTQKWGQRVKHPFNVARGEPIGQKVKMELSPLDGGAPEAVSVDFTTGAVLVDIDFDRKQRIAKMGHVTTTTEILYLDAGGQLCTRLELGDKNSEEYKKLDLEVQQGGGAVQRPLGS